MEEQNVTDKEARKSWILFALLVFFRVVLCPFLPGYIHPDEFFQGGQQLWFGCPPFTPWEFQPEHALRSVIPPTIMTWLPLRIYAWLSGAHNMYNLSGREVLVVPRIFCGIFSVLIVDMSTWHLSSSSPSSRKGVPPAVILVTSAWPSLVLLNRPYTNSLETMLLALLLLVTNQRQTTHGFSTDLVVGITCALGLFTRFTFVFVAIPTMLRFLVGKTCMPASRALLGIFIMAIGFLGTSVGIIYIDLLYYNESNSWLSYVAPWNALEYNAWVENLQHHGLHPRWTHATVNMLLLYGPLAIAFYAILVKRILLLFSTAQTTGTKQDDSKAAQTRIRTTCVWTVMSGLGFLSMAPHQEPRFLLPLLVPLAILSQHCWKSCWVRAVWITFNVILLLVYGVLHQGAIIQSLVAIANIGNQGNAPQTIIYYHTYMPPTFVLRKRNADPETCSASAGGDTQGSCSMESLGCGNVAIIDLKESSVETLLSTLNEHVACGNRGENDSYGEEQVYLVSPPLKMDCVAIGTDCFLGASPYSCRRIQSYRPHLTTEDFPPFDGSIVNMLSNMELGVYEITCQ